MAGGGHGKRRRRSGRTRRLALLAACLSAGILAMTAAPASAAVAPVNDNFLASINLNAPRTPLSTVATLQDVTDTIGASVQPDIFSPCGMTVCPRGPGELSTCNGVSFGRTVWYDFYPDHDGQVEIRTAGIPSVIALYTYAPHSLLPQLVQCAPGSAYASNELVASVRAGVDYTYQVGGREGIGGSLQMLFNYAYNTQLTVTPFRTAAVFSTAQPGQIRLLRLRFIGLARGESVSAVCSACRGATFGTPVTSGNTVQLTASVPPLTSDRMRLVIGASSPAQIGRFKIYAVDSRRFRLPVIASGCLAPGVSSVSPAAVNSPLPGAVPCPTTFVNQIGAEYIFWAGPGQGLWEKWYSGVRWSAPIRLGPDRLGSAPAVAVHANGEQDVFWQGAHGHLRESWYAGQWNGPVDLGAAGLVSAPTAGVDSMGDEYVFWQGSGGGLWEKTFADGRWSTPIGPRFGRLGSAPALAVHANGEQDVFWRGTDSHLWESWYTGRWHGPVDLGAGRLGSAPAVAVDGAGNEYVVWKGTDGGLWEKSYTAGQWSAPIRLLSARLASAPAIAVHANGAQEVFWKDTRGRLRETFYTNHWAAPVDLGGQLGSGPGTGVDAVGKGSAGG